MDLVNDEQDKRRRVLEVGSTPGVTEIEEIHDAEEDNYRLAIKILGDTVSLAQDLTELYQLLPKISVTSKVAGRDDVVAALHMLMACKYQLTVGCLAALRGHLTDSFRSSRMAIEQAGFAARIKRSPYLALVWLNASQSHQAYADYRKKFSGRKKIFPDNHPLLKELGDRYGFSSKLGHPSVYSMASQTKVTTTAAGVNLQFNYFQLKNNDPTEPTQTFLWIVDTHFKILCLFEEILSDAIAHDRAAWEVHRNGVDVRLAVHKEKWKKILGK